MNTLEVMIDTFEIDSFRKNMSILPLSQIEMLAHITPKITLEIITTTQLIIDDLETGVD